MPEDSITYFFFQPHFPHQVAGQLRMGVHVPTAKLHVDIMQQAGQAPFSFILPQPPGQCFHDGFGGQHMFYQVLVLYVGLYLFECLLSVHLEPPL